MRRAESASGCPISPVIPHNISPLYALQLLTSPPKELLTTVEAIEEEFWKRTKVSEL